MKKIVHSFYIPFYIPFYRISTLNIDWDSFHFENKY